MKRLTLLALFVVVLVCAAPTSAATLRAKRGASNIGACGDLSTLGASWWFNWSQNNALGCDGFVPMVYSDKAPLTLPADYAGYVLLANEPNLGEQADMSLDALVEHCYDIETALPLAKLVSPALFMTGKYGQGQKYSYTYTDLVNAFQSRYGRPPRWSAWAVHSYAYTPSQVVAWVDAVRKEQVAVGMGALPVWVTEFGSWPLGNAPWVMRGALAGFKARTWVKRWSWFPARPVADSGVDWTRVSLLDAQGNIKSLGRTYLAYY